MVPFNILSEHHLVFLMTEMAWATNGVHITVEKELVHLDICRSISSPSITIEDCTAMVQKIIYVLMGSGLYGLNNLPVTTSIKIYNSYMIPRDWKQ